MTRNRKRFWGAIWSLKTGENKVQLFDAPNSPFNNYLEDRYDPDPDEPLIPVTKTFLEKELQRGIKVSGVKKIRIHDLRHSHASLLIELGFSPKEIADRLGHEKIETTLNTYSHLYPNKQAKIAERLDRFGREEE